MYRDNEAAMTIDREEHMIKWNDDDAQDLWIDRYDVRALVDDARWDTDTVHCLGFRV